MGKYILKVMFVPLSRKRNTIKNIVIKIETKKVLSKAEKIKERDQWCCLVCLAGLYGDKKITYRNLEVHHIEKLRDNIDLGLENNNLITLCPTHHRMADKGEIPKSTLKQLIPKEKEENYVY
mgnify:CR=1 FL=1